MGYDARFRVWRGDAAGGDLADFTVEVNEGEVVLDVIHRLQATQTPDLAVRWNCKAGKCGSCSAEINGRPRLLCMTRMSTFGEDDTITVTPLRAFPVVRDLVTDVSFNYAKAREVPAFSPPPELAPGDYRMQQVDVERSQEFRKCIECFLCQNTCHVIRDHEDNKPAFAGPRLFIRLAELDMHPLDAADRKREAQEAHGLGYCNITKCCTEVCPEHIKITDNGIIPMKERVVDTRYDPLVWLGSKIPRRCGEAARKARSGDAAGAEAAARARLETHPRDRAARQSLHDALLAQGRFRQAAAVAGELLDPPPRGSDARARTQAAHAWALLCAIEAGQLRPGTAVDSALSQARQSLAEAQRVTAGGTVLSSVSALLAVTEGRLDDAAREALDSRAWDRSDEERAQDALTLARTHLDRGELAQARASLNTSRSLFPTNPRLPAVARAVDAAAQSQTAGQQ
jgi:succinate dehydrogenase / fumarate reductase iron-sulfur subunit